MEISCSTPGYRFDVKAPPAAAGKSETPPPVTAEAEAFVAEVIGDAEQQVVLFALEWCEFCWSVRKLFGKLDIPYRAIDLDSVEYQADAWGSQIRAALNATLGSNTIPQVFIGGEHIGGATDTFEAAKSGELHSLLENSGIEAGELGDMDPYELLPNWLHKR